MKLFLLGAGITGMIFTVSLRHETMPRVLPGTAALKADSVMEVKVSDLKEYGGDQYVVELEPKENKSGYILPVVIGPNEISSLYNYINERSSPRPLTYDLVTNIFKATDIKIKKMCITELKNGVFYAVITIAGKDKTIEIDSRPSDALNLALRANAPLYVAKAVFDEAKEKKAGN